MTRLLFAQAGVKYEDVRLTGEQWGELKASGKAPFGQLPILEVDGTVIAQSGTIFRYVAEEVGLSPSSNLDKARASMIVDAIGDTAQKIMQYFYEKDEAKKEELKKDFYSKHLPTQLGHFEKLLMANGEGKGFFIGDKVSSADIMFFAMFNGLLVEEGKAVAPKELKGPLLDLYNRVMNLPNIKAWIDSRPATKL